jgi:hypothetical protein
MWYNNYIRFKEKNSEFRGYGYPVQRAERYYHTTE